MRPAAEHDLLARDLASSLLHATDAAQAGTLAWGLTNLKGLTDAGRIETVRSILDSMRDPRDPVLRQSCVQAVSRIVAAGYANRPLDVGFDRIVDATQDALRRNGNDEQVTAQLSQLITELHALEQKQAGEPTSRR